MKTSNARRLQRSAGRLTAGWNTSNGWFASIRSRSVVRRDQTWRPTRGLFDHVRKIFAATTSARARHYDAGRFSFNVAKGRCENCQGEGFVCVELLFLPSVYTPCPVCHGARYNTRTLEITYRDKNIAQVLGMTVDAAYEFFTDEPPLHARWTCFGRSDSVTFAWASPRRNYPAAKRSASSWRRSCNASPAVRRSISSTSRPPGLHPFDVEKLVKQLDGLVDAGNTVIVVEHDMQVVAQSDWVIDIGPGAGDEGGRIIASGPPREVAVAARSRTAPFLARHLGLAEAKEAQCLNLERCSVTSTS